MSNLQKRLVAKPKSKVESSPSTPSPDGKQETVQEMLAKLEEDFNTKLQALNELRDEHNKLKDKIVVCHDDMFRSYQKLMLTKENLLVNTVNAQQKELAKRNEPPHRDDNVLNSVEEEVDENG